MPAKKLTPQQQRDKRAKIMLGVLGVVLLIVMAVELPGLLGGNKSAAPPATVAATTTTAGAAAPASSGASLASVQVVATPQGSQLTKFARFARKDPFHPLVSAATAPTGGSKPASAPSSPKTGTPPATPPAKPVGTPKTVTFAAKPTTTAAQPSGPMVLGAVLKLNGQRQVVPVGAQFPVANPVFKLVAVGRKAMWISLVGGSFGDGNQALKVEFGHPVKLVNTTADLSFVLDLLKVKLVPKPAAPPPAPATTALSTTTGAATTAPSTTASSGP